jgi:Ca2+-transporting ATPase
MSSVLLKSEGGEGYCLYNKGAAEWVIQRSSHVCTATGEVESLQPQKMEQLLSVVTDMANRGLRCICLTYRDYPLEDYGRHVMGKL